MSKQAIFAFLVLIIVSTVPASAAPVASAEGVAQPFGDSDLPELLYGQENAATVGFNDQEYQAAYSTFDCEGADDFVVDAPGGWRITAIHTKGFQNPTGGSALFVNHFFYRDAGGQPGPVVEGCAFPGNTAVQGADTLATPIDCEAPPGHLWFSQQVRMDFDPGGAHYWSLLLETFNDGAVWRNPDDGYGTGCTDWELVENCDNPTFFFGDFQFRLTGFVNDAPPTPATDPLGLLILALSLAAAGGWMVARSRI